MLPVFLFVIFYVMFSLLYLLSCIAAKEHDDDFHLSVVNTGLRNRLDSICFGNKTFKTYR